MRSAVLPNSEESFQINFLSFWSKVAYRNASFVRMLSRWPIGFRVIGDHMEKFYPFSDQRLG